MAYSGIYVFGDSLVDSGNALKLAQWYGSLPFSDLPDGAPTSALGYFQGRFTNGYTFADLISNKTIGLVTKPVFPYGFEDPWLGIPVDPFASDPNGNNLNFAYGGAQIRQGEEVVPDFDGQTDAFKDAIDNHAPSGALYLVTMGGNDVRDLVPTESNPALPVDAHAALDAAADKMLHELEQLVDIGAHDFLITGVPDVGLIPGYDANANGVLDGAELARSAAATEYSAYLDLLIRTQVVPALQALGAKVTYVPVMDHIDGAGNMIDGALTAVLPTIAALHGLTAEELSDNMLQYQNLVFFDQVHPTAQAHALVGSYMLSLLNGTPWVETLPLMGSDVDYRVNATIGAVGEVDTLSFALVAGTTYTFEMLGVSSLGVAGSLGDPTLRLMGPSGSVVGANDDSGAGFDATLTFTVATTGAYLLELSAVGSLNGSYAAQAAVVSGAAMAAGNIYTVNSAATLVLESAGGLGVDVVKASLSYALTAGSEIEELRTTNDRGKTAINLTGNDFGQTIIGNAGDNVIEGKGGADTLYGGQGKDVFVLSNAPLTLPGSADAIQDYGKGDVVDITQVLSVAAGTNVIAGGYLRVTGGGLIQVDLDGGGNNWVTLSTVNGNSAVAVRYLSGGVATSTSVSRATGTASRALANDVVLVGAVAAAGLAAMPAAAHDSATDHSETSPALALIGPMAPLPADVIGHASLPALALDVTQPGDAPAARHPAAQPAEHALAYLAFAADSAVPNSGATVSQGTDLPAAGASPIAATVAMPPADMLAALAPGLAGVGDAKITGELSRVLLDALPDRTGAGTDVDALLHSLPGGPHPEGLDVLSTHLGAGWHDLQAAIAMETLTIHPDAAPHA